MTFSSSSHTKPHKPRYAFYSITKFKRKRLTHVPFFHFHQNWLFQWCQKIPPNSNVNKQNELKYKCKIVNSLCNCSFCVKNVDLTPNAFMLTNSRNDCVCVFFFSFSAVSKLKQMPFKMCFKFEVFESRKALPNHRTNNRWTWFIKRAFVFGDGKSTYYFSVNCRQ